MSEKKNVYKIHSSSIAHAPGILKWAINGYAFKEDRKKLLRVFTHGFDHSGQVPEEVFDRLLKGEIPYTVDGDTVVFEV
jgi:hypothetical protein